MHKGMHHFHIRKRIHQNFEPYPHPDKWKRAMDRLIYFIGIAGPLMTIPQVWLIWFEHKAAGVALVSWASYMAFSLFWLAYGVMHREKPIIITYMLWFILEAAIVAGVLIYG